MSIFTKKPESPSEKAGDKKLANMPPLAAPTVSPLARFLLTRLVHSYISFSLPSNAHDK
jgi:serine/threonine-protein kinase 24/25/MST4